MTDTETEGTQVITEMDCGTCGETYCGLAEFKDHLEDCGDYDTVSEAVRDCNDVREVTPDGGRQVERGKQSTIAKPPTPSSVSDLTLVRERTKQPVNEFLEQRHPLGGVPGWKACFSGRYRDSIVAVVVVGRPVARAADDGTELSITRFCRRDDRPANTGSWLIARARNWARLEGFDTLTAHAGVAGNYGTVYEAAGFECRDVTMADGSGWLTQGEDRDTWDDYERRKWVSDL